MALYYEDYEIGQHFVHPWRRTVNEMDNTLFSMLTMNPQPLHIDAEFASTTEWGQRLVNSYFTLALMVGLSVHETTLGTTVANLGMENTRFPRPVFHGDTLRAESEVIGKRESKSRPECGIVVFKHVCIKQSDEIVAVCERAALMRKK
ncbi:Acyl dehydratase OS=Castellaniella defragrans OX=75697 GN=HNR28_003330 PE=4 SV=1 [Castellaniella defragrans]